MKAAYSEAECAMRWLCLVLTLSWGCADLRASGGEDNPFASKTKTIELGCMGARFADNALVGWDLTVDPGDIMAGQPFRARLEGVARFHERFLNLGQVLVTGGMSRVELYDLQATVHVRRGAVDPADVVLRADPALPRTCRYDDSGNDAWDAGPFPTCSQANDNPDGSNDDCTGLGGTRRPENSCGVFVDIPISSDCTPGGECDVLGKRWVDIPSAFDLCEDNGFCVTDPVAVRLVPLTGESAEYVADSSGRVLFGWDDASTGAELLQDSGPNDGTWFLPKPELGGSLGPNGLHFEGGGFEEVMECTMGVGSWSEFGVQSYIGLTSPSPDHALISFPILEARD
jgi:hypothetical protein